MASLGLYFVEYRTEGHVPRDQYVVAENMDQVYQEYSEKGTIQSIGKESDSVDLVGWDEENE